MNVEGSLSAMEGTGLINLVAASRRRWLLAVLSSTFVGCQKLPTERGAPPSGARAPQTKRALVEEPGPAFRIETSKGLAYLLPSVPVIREGFWPLPPRLHRAMRQSEVYALEVHVPEEARAAAAQKLVAKARYPSGQSLLEALSPERLSQLEQALGSHDAVLALSEFRPWFLALNLHLAKLTAIGATEEHSLEHRLVSSVGSRRVVSLITVEEQVEQLASLGDAAAFAWLMSIHRTDWEAAILAANHAWLVGDAKGAARSLVVSLKQQEGVFERIYAPRAKRVAESLLELLCRASKAFLVVDAAMLFGEGLLLSELSSRGARVVPA